MNSKNIKVLDVVVVGTGLAGLNFIDKYLEKKNKIDVISPSFEKDLETNIKTKIKLLPSQMRGKYNNVRNYYNVNNLEIGSNCKALGSLNFGGLSNYWGLQIDSYIKNNEKYLGKRKFNQIAKHLVEFLKKFKLVGSFKINGRKVYNNDFNLPNNLNKLNENAKKFICRKPILAFSTSKNFNGNLNTVIEEKQKLTAKNFFKKIKKKENIIFHNYYLEKIKKKNNLIQLTCKDNKSTKRIFTKKIVMACGTIATTKIIADFLNIKKEVRIKHHPRLLSVFFAKQKIDYKLNFTPSLLQIINKSSKLNYTADLRPGNKLITKSIIDAFPYVRPFGFLINFLRKRLIFSNFLLDPLYSNIYLKKKRNDKFELYSKEIGLRKILRKENKNIFRYLFKKRLIYPFYKTFFPGNGADYHYFGSIPFQKSGNLGVNDNCQLLSSKNIYIIDGSVFNFKANKYPLGIVVANARRIAKLLS